MPSKRRSTSIAAANPPWATGEFAQPSVRRTSSWPRCRRAVRELAGERLRRCRAIRSRHSGSNRSRRYSRRRRARGGGRASGCAASGRDTRGRWNRPPHRLRSRRCGRPVFGGCRALRLSTDEDFADQVARQSRVAPAVLHAEGGVCPVFPWFRICDFAPVFFEAATSAAQASLQRAVEIGRGAFDGGCLVGDRLRDAGDRLPSQGPLVLLDGLAHGGNRLHAVPRVETRAHTAGACTRAARASRSDRSARVHCGAILR